MVLLTSSIQFLGYIILPSSMRFVLWWWNWRTQHRFASFHRSKYTFHSSCFFILLLRVTSYRCFSDIWVSQVRQFTVYSNIVKESEPNAESYGLTYCQCCSTWKSSKGIWYLFCFSWSFRTFRRQIYSQVYVLWSGCRVWYIPFGIMQFEWSSSTIMLYELPKVITFQK